MVTRFAGKVAIVTGAGGGIGGAIARQLAAEGARVIAVDRAFAGETPGEPIVCDLADAAAVERVVPEAIARGGRLDLLVNVAGMMIFKSLSAHQAEDWHRLLGVNLVAPARLIGAALPVMGEGSAIVNVASVHARRTSAQVAAYAASKAALVSLTRSTAIEGKPRGIRCNAVLPGAIDTAMLRDSPNIRSGEEVIDPADVGRPEDIAELTCFLLSDAARFVTGADMVADSGRMGKL
jgi:NAD(P)-dependent dehydrogenase (short-subunit alcohol dehydrogenase family)